MLRLLTTGMTAAFLLVLVAPWMPVAPADAGGAPAEQIAYYVNDAWEVFGPHLDEFPCTGVDTEAVAAAYPGVCFALEPGQSFSLVVEDASGEAVAASFYFQPSGLQGGGRFCGAMPGYEAPAGAFAVVVVFPEQFYQACAPHPATAGSVALTRA